MYLKENKFVRGLPGRKAWLHRPRVPVLVNILGVVVMELLQVVGKVALELRLHG